MELIGIKNPFPGAGSFLVASTESTQDEARRLAARGYPPGSLIVAEEQSAGRGRFPERKWESEPGKNLLFTVILAPEVAALPGLPLRIGLALCAAVQDYASLTGARFASPPRIKWPNDLLIGDRKAAGILCEAGARAVFAGLGLNCNQTAFPPSLETAATSLARELGREVSRWAILERFLEFLRRALGDDRWREAVEARLWRRGEEACFLPGLAGKEGAAASPIVGTIEGIDDSGSLSFRSRGETAARSYPAGELTVAPGLYKVLL
jgi:BirA family transcriptional regulator, biotin operon repressor / biotin---[acetyl-CoA-carboxylase] ligase